MSSPPATRFPLLALAGLALLAGLWAALARLGWAMPLILSPGAHGPLMMDGFLGTLISLERAVALAPRLAPNRWRYWPYLAPLLCGLGGLLLMLGAPIRWSIALFTLGSLGLALIFVVINRLHFDLAHGVMGLGALAWLMGNALWWSGAFIAQAAPWWAGFLILTIAGERLELARIVLNRPRARQAFVGCVSAFLAGLLLSVWRFEWGVRLAGLGLIALGLWLLRYDLARRTIRQSGLTRFIAACLLPGYAWLIVTGALWLLVAPYFLAGPVYDAMLHTLLLGFGFSMIFGHAPLILPAVLNVHVPYTSWYYAHLSLLHLSLLLRVIGDLAGLPDLRLWSGTLNVIVVLLFVGVTAAVTLRARRESRNRA